MDFLKKQLAHLQEQYAALSASQKMLAVSLVAIMVMTLFWWGNYAGTAEMVDVYPHDFTTEELATITLQLTGNQIPNKAVGNRVQVPQDRRIQAMSVLQFAQLLPRDTSSAFEDTISKMSSPIDPPSKTDSIQNHAREVMLAQMIRYFPKVRSAMVAINPSVHRSFDNSVMPSATVMMQLDSSQKPDKRLVNAAADTLVGAVAGLERKSVKVIVDGAPQPVDDGDLGDITGSNLMDRIREWETYYSRKVQEQILIDGAMVHVAVVLNDERMESHQKVYDPKATVKAELQTSTHTEEIVNFARSGSSDPGVNANGSLAVPTPAASGGGDQNHTTTDDSKSQFQNNVASKESWSVKMAGSPTVRSASVSLPRSYFSKIYQRNMGTDKDPSKAVLEPFIDEQLPFIRKAVKGCLGLDSEESVVLTTYTDLLPAIPEGSAQASSGVSMLIGGHLKDIVLGALALVSLFMVTTMVRKAAPVVKTPEDEEAAAVLAAGKTGKGKGPTGDETAEVGEGVATLDGVELDNETIRSQQMADQVTTLVKENPDAAANLVKRWLNRA